MVQTFYVLYNIPWYKPFMFCIPVSSIAAMTVKAATDLLLTHKLLIRYSASSRIFWKLALRSLWAHSHTNWQEAVWISSSSLPGYLKENKTLIIYLFTAKKACQFLLLLIISKMYCNQVHIIIFYCHISLSIQSGNIWTPSVSSNNWNTVFGYG